MSLVTMRPVKRLSSSLFRCARSVSSTEAPAPPLLAKFKSDLKVAMKAKDTNRLNVLRALIADATNASKSATPLRSDLQVLAMLRKRSASSRSAAQEFAAANRTDLKEKEEAQIAVLDEYASGVETIDKREIKQAVYQTIEKLRTEGATLNIGSIMRAVSSGGGPLDGKPVEKGEVAQAIKDAISNPS